jgi:hypothetical protein
LEIKFIQIKVNLNVAEFVMSSIIGIVDIAIIVISANFVTGYDVVVIVVIVVAAAAIAAIAAIAVCGCICCMNDTTITSSNNNTCSSIFTQISVTDYASNTTVTITFTSFHIFHIFLF